MNEKNWCRHIRYHCAVSCGWVDKLCSLALRFFARRLPIIATRISSLSVCWCKCLRTRKKGSRTHRLGDCLEIFMWNVAEAQRELFISSPAKRKLIKFQIVIPTVRSGVFFFPLNIYIELDQQITNNHHHRDFFARFLFFVLSNLKFLSTIICSEEVFLFLLRSDNEIQTQTDPVDDWELMKLGRKFSFVIKLFEFSRRYEDVTSGDGRWHSTIPPDNIASRLRSFFPPSEINSLTPGARCEVTGKKWHSTKNATDEEKLSPRSGEHAPNARWFLIGKYFDVEMCLSYAVRSECKRLPCVDAWCGCVSCQ